MNTLYNALIKRNDSASPEGVVIEYQGKEIRVPQFIDLREFGYDIAVAKYPITNDLFKQFIYGNLNIRLPYRDDERFDQSIYPVVGIKEKDACAYCKWLSHVMRLSIKLPDAKVWEKIARCDTDVEYSTPDGSCSYSYMNFDLSCGGTSPVNHFPNNKWGVHDMCGNVLEWTESIPDFCDVQHEIGSKPAETEKDLRGLRILKGGCWSFDESNSKISANIILDRLSTYYVTGFRPIVEL